MRTTIVSLLVLLSSIASSRDFSIIRPLDPNDASFLYNVNKAKREILDPNNNMFIKNPELDSYLSKLLQRQLSKVRIDSTVKSITHDLPGLSETECRKLENEFLQLASDVLNKFGVETITELDPNIPTLSMSVTFRAISLGGPDYYKMYVATELIRHLVDPETGLNIPCTIWKEETTGFEHEKYKHLDGRAVVATEIQLWNFYVNEYKRAVYKVALQQLRKENKLPGKIKAALSNYKDW